VVASAEEALKGPQPPPLAANGESKKQEWPKESGENDDAVKASEPLHPSACSLKDDKCSLYANAEKNYVTEYQISRSDNDSFEAEMEAIAQLPSSTDLLPAVALASTANAYRIRPIKLMVIYSSSLRHLKRKWYQGGINQQFRRSTMISHNF
jgi:hypothetical protein